MKSNYSFSLVESYCANEIWLQAQDKFLAWIQAYLAREIGGAEPSVVIGSTDGEHQVLSVKLNDVYSYPGEMGREIYSIFSISTREPGVVTVISNYKDGEPGPGNKFIHLPLTNLSKFKSDE